MAAPASVLNVNVDHGVPLTLSAPAASVFIANPEIADVQVMSPTSIMIFGKRTGETTFMATDTAGNTLAERTVLVLQDLSGAARRNERRYSRQQNPCSDFAQRHCPDRRGHGSCRRRRRL